MALPASKLREYCGPVSYTKVLEPTCTTMAVPWPTSRTVTVKSSAVGGLIKKLKLAATLIPITPKYLGSKPRGNNITTTLSASSSNRPGEKATTGLAQEPANASKPSKNTASHSIAPAAIASKLLLRPNHTSPTAAPISNKGTTKKVISGMAIALPTGATSETVLTNKLSGSISPINITHWERMKPISSSLKVKPAQGSIVRLVTKRPEKYMSNSATAPKDNQKPMSNAASGSKSTTSAKAQQKISLIRRLRRAKHAA